MVSEYSKNSNNIMVISGSLSPSGEVKKVRDPAMRNFQVKNVLDSLVPFCGIFLLSYLIGMSMLSVAEDEMTSVHVVRTISAANLNISTLSGLAYSNKNGGYFILTGREIEDAPDLGSDPLRILPKKMIGPENFAIAISDSKNIVFDATVNRLLIHRVAFGDIVEVGIHSNGDVSPTLLTSITLRSLGVQSIKGMGIDSDRGRLFLLEGDTKRVVIIQTGVSSRFVNAGITEFNLNGMGLGDLTAITFNPLNGLLYLFDASNMTVKELSVTGELKNSYDFSKFNLKNPGAMVFAPSGNRKDAPSETNLYIVDQGSSDAGLITEGQGLIEFSLIQEATLDPLLAEVSSVPTVPVFLVQTIDSSQFSPPSPDTSGITYLKSADALLISDSEVTEIPSLFSGVNIFESTVSGVLQNSFSTTRYSLEPTGISVNLSNNHFFVSDDDTQAIFEINPGFDGIHGTLDDIVTSFSTAAFGCLDPEGVTYASDVGQGDLFIADGISQEIYHIGPGFNGVFDGQPPVGDDILVGHFDVAVHHINDPEGIEYDLANGTLYISSGSSRQFNDPIIETDINGNLVRIIDVSGVNYTVASGIALAPGSQNPNVTNLFIADRGVDNNTDSNENDGRVHELTFNQFPIVRDGVDKEVVLPNTAALMGSAIDNGLFPLD